jgi:predicted RNA-binding Zn ribbon-like protein
MHAETPAFLLPDEPVPVRLMNTIWADRTGPHDALVNMDDLRAWLREVHEDTQSSPRPADLARFRQLRDALRRLAATLTEDTRTIAPSAMTSTAEAVREVNEAVAEAPGIPHLSYQNGALHRSVGGPVHPARRALASIAERAIDLLTGEHAMRLRACYAPGCVLYFVKDHPRREWCSPHCGNRVRAARHYARHRKAATA